MAKIRLSLSGVNPLFKGILYILGGLLLFLLLLQMIITLFADDYAANKLKDQIRQSSDSTYTLSFEEFDLSVFSGSATISKARLHADTSAFSESSSSKSPPGMLFRGMLDKIEIKGINIFSSLMGDELRISSIRLNQPDISALKNPHDRKVSKDSNQSTSIDSMILGAIANQYSALEIDEFIIREGYGIFTESGDTLTSIRQLDLSLRDIRVDSASAQSGRTFITDDISLNAGNFMMKLPDSLNIVRFSQLSVSSDEETVALDSLQLIPRYGKLEFARRNGSPIDRIDLTIPKIRFESVDFSQFVDSAHIYARYGQISNPRLEDYYNRGVQGGPPTYVPLPLNTFRNLKTPVKVDSLRVKNAYISYSEYLGGTPEAGMVTFEGIEAIFRNISNYPEDKEEGIITTLDAQARVMGNGLLGAHFQFPMDTKNDFHKVEGQLDRMPMTDFNRMMEHVAFIRIDRGQLNSLKFEMTLNDDQSSGTLVMNYEDFKISVLDKQTIQQRGLLENMATFLANNFIVRENNTPEEGRQAGRIQFERDKSKSIFNFWWKSLLSGIKDSISR